MANAKPARMGTPTTPSKPRDTRKPVRWRPGMPDSERPPVKQKPEEDEIGEGNGVPDDDVERVLNTPSGPFRGPTATVGVADEPDSEPEKAEASSAEE